MRVAKGDYVDIQTTISSSNNNLLLQCIQLKKELGQKVSKKEYTGEILNTAIENIVTKEIEEAKVRFSEIQKIKNG